MGDLVGRKRAYVLGLLAYATGALAMALAQSLTAVVVFWAIIGLVVLVAGIFVFVRSPWARWVGVLAATVQAIFAFFWLFTPYWPAALAIIVIDMVVLHALIAYGERDDAYV